MNAVLITGWVRFVQVLAETRHAGLEWCDATSYLMQKRPMFMFNVNGESHRCVISRSPLPPRAQLGMASRCS